MKEIEGEKGTLIHSSLWDRALAVWCDASQKFKRNREREKDEKRTDRYAPFSLSPAGLERSTPEV